MGPLIMGTTNMGHCHCGLFSSKPHTRRSLQVDGVTGQPSLPYYTHIAEASMEVLAGA